MTDSIYPSGFCLPACSDLGLMMNQLTFAIPCSFLYEWLLTIHV